MIDQNEYATNYRIQKMYADFQILDVPMFEVDFHVSPGKPPIKQQFFFYQGKWRNTNPKSEFGAVIFDEHQILSKIFTNE